MGMSDAQFVEMMITSTGRGGSCGRGARVFSGREEARIEDSAVTKNSPN